MLDLRIDIPVYWLLKHFDDLFWDLFQSQLQFLQQFAITVTVAAPPLLKIADQLPKGCQLWLIKALKNNQDSF